MGDLGYFTKTAKLDAGVLGTALALTLNDKKFKKTAIIGVLTVSDLCARGLANDIIGQKVQSVISQLSRFQVIVKVRKIVGDNVNEIKQTLSDWSDNLGLDLILTTGGAGLSPRDVTPDATRAVVDREAPGVATAMTMGGIKIDAKSIFFRGVCGIRKNVLIVNLPGNLQGAADYLQIILPSLPFGISTLKRDKSAAGDSEDNLALAQTQTVSINTLVNATGNTTSSGSYLGLSTPPQTVPAVHSIPSVHTLTGTHTLTGIHALSAPSNTHALAGAHALTGRHTLSAPSTAHAMQPPIHAITPAISSTPLPSDDRSQSAAQTSSLADSGIITSHVVPLHHIAEVAARESHSTRYSHQPIHAGGDAYGMGGLMENVTEAELFEEESTGPDEIIRIIGDRPPSRDTSDSAVSGMGLRSYQKLARRPRSCQYACLSVDKAFAQIFAFSEPMPVITRHFKDSLDHVVVDNVTAISSVPPDPTAILDGYAVIASDVPGDLEVVQIQPGIGVQLLTMGKMVRVSTGGKIPAGSNAVVPVEETVLLSDANEGSTELSIRCLEPASPGQHIRPRGSDINSGDIVVKAGTRLGHVEVGLLASVGVTSVRVHRLPIIAIISLGKQLKEPDSLDLQPGDIRDTNRISLLLALQKQGYPTEDMGIVNGTAPQLKEAIIKAYEKADVILTTGGMAMGENDYVKPLLREIGATLHVGRVQLKPGAPTAFATLDTPRGKKYFFALSGVPVPAYVGYYTFVLPCLRKLSGMRNPRSKIIKARLSSDVYLDTVPEYQRAVLRDDQADLIPWADVTGHQIISRLASMVEANSLLLLPPKSDDIISLKRGEVVSAMLIG